MMVVNIIRGDSVVDGLVRLLGKVPFHACEGTHQNRKTDKAERLIQINKNQAHKL